MGVGLGALRVFSPRGRTAYRRHLGYASHAPLLRNQGGGKKVFLERTAWAMLVGILAVNLASQPLAAAPVLALTWAMLMGQSGTFCTHEDPPPN